MGKTREIDEVTPNFASLFTPEVVADMKKKFGPDFLNFDSDNQHSVSEEDKARFDVLEKEIDEEHRRHIDYLKNLYLTGKTLEGRSLSKFELFDIKKSYEQLTGEKLEWIYD